MCLAGLAQKTSLSRRRRWRCSLFSSGTITRKERKQWWNQLTWSGDGTDVPWLNIQYPDVTFLGYDKQAWNIQNGSYRHHPNPFSSIRRLLLSIVDFRNHKCVGIFYEYFTLNIYSFAGMVWKEVSLWSDLNKCFSNCFSSPHLIKTLTFASFLCRAMLVIFIRKTRKTTANVKLFRLDIRFMLRGVECVHKSLLACVSIQAQYVRKKQV